MLNRSGQIFGRTSCDPAQGSFMNHPNFKNLSSKVFNFCKILKMRKKNIMKSANFFIGVLYSSKLKKMLTDKATIKNKKIE